MKKIVTIVVAILMTANVWAQSPKMMSYQAVVRNSIDALVINSSIGIQISILQNSTTGTAVYVERQFPTTNSNGLVSIEIGNGTVVSGDITTIDWANGPYFVKTEIDLNGGANYTIIGTSQFLSVPYAFYAETTNSASSQSAFHVSGSSSWQAVSGSDTYINWTNEEYDLGNNISSNVYTPSSFLTQLVSGDKCG